MNDDEAKKVGKTKDERMREKIEEEKGDRETMRR